MLLAFGGVLLAGGGLCFWVQRKLAMTISMTPIAEKMSPDGRWKALVDDTFYEPSWGGGVVISSVHLASVLDPAKITDILSVDRGEPRIAWTSADVLQVTVANLSYLTVKRREYDGVRIDIRFEPDDPAQRAAWLKWLQEPSHPDKTTRLVEVSSADPAWAAAVDQTVYGFSFIPLVLCTVRLIPSGKLAEAVDILSVETNGPNKDPPHIAWTAADVLQITVPNRSYLRVNRREYADVRIDLRFNPDDPAARAAWLKKQRELPQPQTDK